jgi:nicotinate-nucleotide--dimethylbenzimidazole phosphoribosyltransferase
VICYDRSVLNNFTIGTVGNNEQSSLARSVRHKIFGFPNGTRIFHGLGFHINYYQFKQLLGLPDNMEPLGIFCVGKPATIMIINPCCNN